MQQPVCLEFPSDAASFTHIGLPATLQACDMPAESEPSTVHALNAALSTIQ